MAISGRSWGWKLATGVVMSGAIASLGDCTSAQITPDGTLPNNSVVTRSSNTSVIEGGTQAGTNLFHSFEQFSVPTQGAAYFNNTLNIQNIISRVTGRSISNIDGLLRTNGTANLFLLNPNGIIFGSNASLNIGGSFVGSTASSINFAHGTKFSATAPQTTPLLTVSVPIGLQFGGNPGSIVNQSQAQSLGGETNSAGDPVGLKVQPGKTLALIGGNVILEGGNLTAAGGRIELGSVAGVGEVSLSQTGNSWVLRYDENNAFGDILLQGALLVDASGEGGGDVQLQGARLEITQGANIWADTLGAEAGGKVLVRITKAIALIDDSRITADVFGSGTGGDLSIETGRLSVSDGSRVSANTFGIGDGGTLSVTAADALEVIGTTADGKIPSGLFARTQGDGDAGDLTITTGRFLVKGGSQVSAATLGTGDGGTLSVTAKDAVEVIGTSADDQFISGLVVGSRGAGDAGELTIATGQLTVQDGAGVIVSSEGSGNGGDLRVEANSIYLNNQATLSANNTAGQGNINLRSQDLVLRGNSNIITNATGTATGGNININTDIIAAIENSDISANAQDARGDRS